MPVKTLVLIVNRQFSIVNYNQITLGESVSPSSAPAPFTARSNTWFMNVRYSALFKLVRDTGLIFT